MLRSRLVPLFTLLAFAFTGCGSDDQALPANANLKAGAVQFPADVSAAIDFQAIPAGQYRLQQVRVSQTSVSENVANYDSTHRLAEAGLLKKDADQTVCEVNWKGQNQNLQAREYKHFSQDFNLPLSFTANGTQVTIGKRVHYWNQFRSDSSKMNWDSSSRSSEEGTNFWIIFTEGQLQNNVYTHNLGHANTTARGAVLVEGNQVRLTIEVTINPKSEDDLSKIVIELIYVQ